MTRFRGDKNIASVAILLPTSGPEAELSEEYARMIKLGLADGAKSKIRVTTYDSSTPADLDASMEQILDQGTDVIIGPIYSESTKIVSEKIKHKGPVAISLSNNPALAEDQTFIFGHAPMRQLQQITNHFLDNGYKNYVLLLPAGRYSRTISQILQNMIVASSGVVARIEFYGSAPEEIKKAVNVVSDSVDGLNENAFSLKQPVVIVADDPATLEMLYQFAAQYRLDKKSVIAGDSRIDIEIGQPFDVTFTGSENIVDFYQTRRASKAGVHYPSFMHGIAYDAGKMVGENIGQIFNRQKFLANMRKPESFSGLSGYIHFVDSIAQRKYDIVRKENGRYLSDEPKQETEADSKSAEAEGAKEAF